MVPVSSTVSIVSDFLVLRVECALEDADLCEFLLGELDDELTKMHRSFRYLEPLSWQQLCDLVDDVLGWDGGAQ